MMDQDDILDLISVNGRVCPLPKKWHDFVILIQSNTTSSSSPPVPLILAAWWYASDTDKSERLKSQLKWSERHCTLKEAHDFLLSLKEDEWHHQGE